MRALDTHAHLDFESFDADRSELIKELNREGIGVINPATDLESNKAVDKLSRSQTLVWGALGIHPTDITDEILIKLPNATSDWRKMFDSNSKLVAVGEIGLDYFHKRERADSQKSALRAMLSFAVEVDKPVIFHCREAYGDLLTVVSDYPSIKGVIHCFNGSLEQAEGFLKLGLHLSFTAIITYDKNDQLRDLIKHVPDDRIMIETDSPFLPPQEIRGQRNDPMKIMNVAEVVARSRNTTIDDILELTLKNGQELFKIQ